MKVIAKRHQSTDHRAFVQTYGLAAVLLMDDSHFPARAHEWNARFACVQDSVGPHVAPSLANHVEQLRHLKCS